jgi:serine protease Do
MRREGLRRLRWRGMVHAVSAVTAALTIAGCGGPGQHAAAKTVTVVTSAKPAPSTPATMSFPALVARDRTGVIRIETSTCDGSLLGTGFLISPTLVATVDHVVDGAASISLLQSGRVVANGTVVGEDKQRDLALVRSSVPLAGYRFTLARRAPKLGEAVAAFGFPFGLPLTVTRGSVSGLGRSIPISGIVRRDLVQTDAAVNPGNSGGPLLSTSSDDVVGLVDIGTEANGIGFAVSASVAEPLLTAWRLSAQPVPPAGCSGAPPAASPSPAPSAPNPNGAVQVVYSYWSDLQLGRIANAYALFSSAERSRVGGLQRYVTGISQDPPRQVNVILSLNGSSGYVATVGVDELQTMGASGCTSWGGSYRVVYENGSWRIDSANLSKSRC